MGIHEKREAFLRAMAEAAVTSRRVRVTRTIVIEGTRDWVADTMSRCWVADLGDYQALPPGTVSCTDRKIEEVD